MDSRLHGVPVKVTSSPLPKVPLSSSTGIRAPLTVDSDTDIEFSESYNARTYSSSSDTSDNGFGSEGFESGEDEFETNPERPLTGDIDDGTTEETHYVNRYVFPRAFMRGTDEEMIEKNSNNGQYGSRHSFSELDGEIREHNENIVEYSYPRPFVNDMDDETFETCVEEDEYASSVGPPLLDIGISVLPRQGMPIAQLSGISDDDSIGSEFLEDDGLLDAVKVPGPWVLEKFDSPPKVRVLEVEEGEESEREPEDLLELEVAEDSVSSETVDDVFLSDPKECFVIKEILHDLRLAEKVEPSCPDFTKKEGEISVAGSEEHDLLGTLELPEDAKHLDEEIQACAATYGENNDDFDTNYNRMVDHIIKEETKNGNLLGVDESNCRTINVDVNGSLVFSQNGDGEELKSRTGKEIYEHLGYFTADEIESCPRRSPENEADGKDSGAFSESQVDFEQLHSICKYPADIALCQQLEDNFHKESSTLQLESLESNIDPETENKTKNDEAELVEGEEYKLLHDDAETSVYGPSYMASEVGNQIEQGLSAAAYLEGGSLRDQLQGLVITDSEAEVDTDKESKNSHLFDSAALAELLTAATVGGFEGGNFATTSADGSRDFHLEHSPGLDSTFGSVDPQPNHSSLCSPIAHGKLEEILSEEEKEFIGKIQQIRVKFLRLVHRLKRSPEDSIVSQVLYRLVLATGRPYSQALDISSAQTTALELEAEGRNDLQFSLNILVIGKTGVGKSATINSIFGEEKTRVHPFETATCNVNEVVGTLNGVKVCVVDTPGLRSSFTEQSFNCKILSSIKKFMKKCPPDVVLYVDRADMLSRDLNDLPLLKSVTTFLGTSVWHNAIVTLTHAESTPPDGPSGNPLSYELFIAQRSHVIQQLIGHSIGDLHMITPALMNPVCPIENNPESRRNDDGQLLLPNGDEWRSQLLLLCYSMKILSELNSTVQSQDLLNQKRLFGVQVPSPHLPYFLSSLMQPTIHPKCSNQGDEDVDSDIELGCSPDFNQEDENECDSLSPVRPLQKSEIALLNKEQKKAYFEEYGFCAKLLEEKQWQEDVERLRDMKCKGKDGMMDYNDLDEQETGSPASVTVPLPDVVLPTSFDGEKPSYIYRFLEQSPQVLARPILVSHGWDHDCGYDGVSIEDHFAIIGQFPTIIAVQLMKDKKEFEIHLDSSVLAKHGENWATMVGLGSQPVGKHMAYILEGDTSILGENIVSGLRFEDQLAVGKRWVLLGTTGVIQSQGRAAYGVNFKVRLREKDYPVGQDQSTLGISLMRCGGEFIWGYNLHSQFSVGRNSKMILRAGLNNKRSGHISVSASSSHQIQIAVLTSFPIIKALFRHIFPQSSEKNQAY